MQFTIDLNFPWTRDLFKLASRVFSKIYFYHYVQREEYIYIYIFPFLSSPWIKNVEEKKKEETINDNPSFDLPNRSIWLTLEDVIQVQQVIVYQIIRCLRGNISKKKKKEKKHGEYLYMETFPAVWFGA